MKQEDLDSIEAAVAEHCGAGPLTTKSLIDAIRCRDARIRELESQLAEDAKRVVAIRMAARMHRLAEDAELAAWRALDTFEGHYPAEHFGTGVERVKAVLECLHETVGLLDTKLAAYEAPESFCVMPSPEVKR